MFICLFVCLFVCVCVCVCVCVFVCLFVFVVFVYSWSLAGALCVCVFLFARSVLYLPYCTGDVHTGAALSSYLVAHYGHINVMTALAHMQDYMKAAPPRQVNVAGCSAGSLGAFVNAPFVFETFPDAVHKVWGDSEIGIVAPAQWAGAWSNWQIQLAPNIPGLARRYTEPYRSDITGYMLVQMANYYPSAVFGAYTSNADTVQARCLDVNRSLFVVRVV
jgi:hypothetical protein